MTNLHITCLLLQLLRICTVDCSLILDMINHLASDGVKCLVLINEHNAEAVLPIDTTSISRLSLSLYDTNASLPYLSASGKECLHYMLIFDSVDSSLEFLNRLINVPFEPPSPFLQFSSTLISGQSGMKTKLKIHIIWGETSHSTFMYWMITQVRRKSRHSSRVTSTKRFWML